MNKQFDYTISAVGGEIDEEAIIKLLNSTGLSEIQVERLLNFDAMVSELPNSEVEGFNAACLDYIRYFGMGGGDASTEENMRIACEDTGGDNPQVLARAMYERIAGHCKTAFVAGKIVYNCVKEALGEE